ncbi:helix-turn-helix transcriptional regulator [Clostridium sp. MD294]|uniref:helix-turn-helix domain-containing protein n=1 Tax=Clostridium sp. MD294 TaxID=97138 RepID=UPI0002CCBFE8|nr:helix-turn-helix transcriptional regulator [Clostridium sp. MD294]USF29325.1 hypothetical protein C820_000715 [Clostridium sp. MD294]
MGEFEILGTRLKLLRKRLKVNQIEFSKMIGISSATLSAYETGVKNPSLAVLKNIAETCNVSIDWLCGLSDKESLSNNDSIKTYSDIIKMLVEIEKHIRTNCNILFYDNPDGRHAAGEIIFYDEIMAHFVENWEKMINLHLSNTIDDNLYSLWTNQQLDLYRFDLPNRNSSISNHKIDDDEIDDDDLPF